MAPVSARRSPRGGNPSHLDRQHDKAATACPKKLYARSLRRRASARAAPTTRSPLRTLALARQGRHKRGVDCWPPQWEAIGDDLQAPIIYPGNTQVQVCQARVSCDSGSGFPAHTRSRSNGHPRLLSTPDLAQAVQRATALAGALRKGRRRRRKKSTRNKWEGQHKAEQTGTVVRKQLAKGGFGIIFSARLFPMRGSAPPGTAPGHKGS